jgi:hypothetical protein
VSVGSAVGGALIGALVAGPVGALVGGGALGASRKKVEFAVYFKNGDKALCQTHMADWEAFKRDLFEAGVAVA